MTNKLSVVLVCAIAEYSYFLYLFWLALRARQNMAQFVKILYTKTLNKKYLS